MSLCLGVRQSLCLRGCTCPFSTCRRCCRRPPPQRLTRWNHPLLPVKILVCARRHKSDDWGGSDGVVLSSVLVVENRICGDDGIFCDAVTASGKRNWHEGWGVVGLGGRGSLMGALARLRWALLASPQWPPSSGKGMISPHLTGRVTGRQG